MILQLTNDYSGSTVYKNLVSKLDEMGVSQTVYTPVRSLKLVGKNKVDLEMEDSKLIYSLILNVHTDRILYTRKINKILKDIQSKIDLNKIDIVHAHTWYSDGGVAFELYKKYKIPYIVAIRNTDLNLFWKFPHLKNYGLEILTNAFKVILISETYKNRILNNSKISPIVESKYEVILNGVDDFWLNNSVRNRINNKLDNINLLYIGNFNSGKNVVNLIKAVLKLKNKHYNIKLSLVGGRGSDHEKVLNLVGKNIETIQYHGIVKDKSELLSIFRQHQIFTMPSKHETFGLVYIEALLQGLPVLYTKNEGIDGLYGPQIGEAVDNVTVDEIASKLGLMIVNLPRYQYNIHQIKSNHDWNLISKKYIKIYNSCI